MIQIQKDKEKTTIFNCRQIIPAQLKKKKDTINKAKGDK